MFQTDLNHFFQAFENPALTAFMRFITALGYMEFFMLFLLIFLLAIDFKKGFILFQVLMWTAAVTFIAKNYFDLPRPFHVDNTLQFLDGQLPDANTFDFARRGATSFWGTLPPEVLTATRNAEHLENGFPSGHTSIAIALWGTLLCLYQEKKWVTGICIVLMVLIPISRIYLGVHFLADVVGGIVLGGVMWFLTYQLVLQKDRLRAFLQQDRFPIGANSYTFFLVLAPLLFLAILPSRVYIIPALMLSFGLGFLLLGQKGIPLDEGTIGMRIGRTLLGAFVFGGVGYLLKLLTTAAGVDGMAIGDFLQNLLAGLAFLWGATELSIRLGWFNRKKQA